MAAGCALAEEAAMKWLLIIGGILAFLGSVFIYALCQVSGLQSDREERERQARYDREKEKRERDSW